MIRIKQLEWNPIVGADAFLSGKGGGHSYTIMTLGDGAGYRVYGVPGDHDGAAQFGTMCEAISAAQAHHEAEIRSVLELSGAASDVLAERVRHVEVEGWTAEHDDQYKDGELARAAGAYALASAFYHADPYQAVLSIWPWDRAWLKPTTARRDLVKAGALILAEIERIDRS